MKQGAQVLLAKAKQRMHPMPFSARVNGISLALCCASLPACFDLTNLQAHPTFKSSCSYDSTFASESASGAPLTMKIQEKATQVLSDNAIVSKLKTPLKVGLRLSVGYQYQRLFKEPEGFKGRLSRRLIDLALFAPFIQTEKHFAFFDCAGRFGTHDPFLLADGGLGFMWLKPSLLGGKVDIGFHGFFNVVKVFSTTTRFLDHAGGMGGLRVIAPYVSFSFNMYGSSPASLKNVNLIDFIQCKVKINPEWSVHIVGRPPLLSAFEASLNVNLPFKDPGATFINGFNYHLPYALSLAYYVTPVVSLNAGIACHQLRYMQNPLVSKPSFILSIKLEPNLALNWRKYFHFNGLGRQISSRERQQILRNKSVQRSLFSHAAASVVLPFDNLRMPSPRDDESKVISRDGLDRPFSKIDRGIRFTHTDNAAPLTEPSSSDFSEDENEVVSWDGLDSLTEQVGEQEVEMQTLHVNTSKPGPLPVLPEQERLLEVSSVIRKTLQVNECTPSLSCPSLSSPSVVDEDGEQLPFTERPLTQLNLNAIKSKERSMSTSKLLEVEEDGLSLIDTHRSYSVQAGLNTLADEPLAEVCKEDTISNVDLEADPDSSIFF